MNESHTHYRCPELKTRSIARFRCLSMALSWYSVTDMYVVQCARKWINDVYSKTKWILTNFSDLLT